MSAKPDYIVSKLTRPTGAAATGGFVINLTSSTTPMALSQPKDPTLAQYTFFVSRRREDGRERFRLHMGYFESMQAAEEMLTVVREVYPQAWAGEAPGKNLKPKAEAAVAPTPPSPPIAPAAVAPMARNEQQSPTARNAQESPTARNVPKPPVARSVQPAPAAAPAAPPPAPQFKSTHHPFASTPPPAPKPDFDEPFVLADGDAEFKPLNVPVVHPPVVSPPAAKATPVVPAKPAAPVAKAAADKKPAPAKPSTRAATIKPTTATKPAAPTVPAARAATAKPASTKSAPAKAAPVQAATRPAPASPAKPPAAAPKIAAQVSAPALRATPKPAPPQAAAPPAKVKAPEPTVQMPTLSLTSSPLPSLNNVRQVLEELDDLTDTQTIRLLERHSPYREGSQEANVDEAIRVVKPEDAQSMAAIKNAVTRNAPVLFAVQLDWAVSPFDMSKVPPLAIFNAYTLYTTEANREGRTWYGLRLGFFSDAVSAKQVAYYVRSDFKTVSVVPVTTIEKERATDINAERSGIHRAANVKDGPAPTPQSISASTSGIFKLLDDDTPAQIVQDVDGESSPRFFKQSADKAPDKPAPKADAAVAGAKSRKPPAKSNRRDAHAQVDEETLDQTLEILGAHTLEITNDSASDTGVRHLRVKVDKKGSKFASLIDRLSGKK